VGEIYRLKVPFERIYTSVFLVFSPLGPILVDCATTAEDVETCILPALRAMGLMPTDIKTLVLTHRHSDHAGGLACLLSHAPQLAVVSDARRLCEGIETRPLPGHTQDAVGLFDARIGALISGDGLQGAGVDKYRCSLEDLPSYLKTLQELGREEALQCILFSHAYEPWYKDAAFGREAIASCLADCKEIALAMKK
jgi:glyoxylase-like metal-dependent hydrolase (beta-lactamase superfamily II)